jgi:c-di-GMP-binding flagellar brake protein YcgR
MATDKRRTQRVDCGGLAGVQKLPAIEEPIFAKIENLSEGGCLMKLDAPSAAHVVLELDEKVELSFEVKQLPFRILARVRVLRSNTMIGFQFCDMSERAKRHLQDLIEELRVP